MGKSRFGAVLALSAFSGSCWFQKTHTVFIPPPPQVQPRIPTEAVSLPQPTMIAGDPLPPETPDSIPTLAPPPAPPAPHRRPAEPTHTAAPPPAPEQPETPRLGPVFTPDQRREYNRALDESLDHVRRALEILASRNLNSEQSQVRNTISTFQHQAEQYRDQDLISAVNLAHRADLLAQDLLTRVQQ